MYFALSGPHYNNETFARTMYTVNLAADCIHHNEVSGVHIHVLEVGFYVITPLEVANIATNCIMVNAVH